MGALSAFGGGIMGLACSDDVLLDADGVTGSVLTGDTILGRGTTVLAPPDGSLAAYLASLDVLAGLGPRRVLPAHGPQLPDLSVVAAAYRAHRQQRLDQIRSALDVLGPDAGVPAILAGDFNVVATDLDIYRVKPFTKDALQQPESKAAFRALVGQGWTDAVRALHPGDPMFSFWDYFRDAWPRDAGMRLDAILLSPELAKRLKSAGVDRWVRGLPGPSDHAPVWAELR